MDKTIIPVSSWPRRFPSGAPVWCLGWLPTKDNTTRRRFQTVNFSFVLAGDGHYCEGDGPRLPVRAPALLVQRPGIDYAFGPSTTWQELYVMYDQNSVADLVARRLVSLRPQDRCRPIPLNDHAVAIAHTLLGELVDPVHIDRLDRLCEAAVMEALAAAPSATDGAKGETSPAFAAVEAMRQALDSHPERDHDLAALANACGLSPAHARRLWKQRYGMPPLAYLSGIRHRLACRLLAETALPIAEIALRSGYTDPQYFARRFRATSGCTPSIYRQQHRNA